MKSFISIFWFRQDLRLSDNPGLIEAARLGKILPIYILDNFTPDPFKMGSASKTYLHHALIYFNQLLNNRLNLYIGDPEKIISKLIKNYAIKHIFWNRCYEPWQVLIDQAVENKLKLLDINYTIFNRSYLWDPRQIKKPDHTPYKVFGAYKRKAYLNAPPKPVLSPKNIIFLKDKHNLTTLAEFKLISGQPWQKKIKQYWTVGEHAAQKKLKNFIEQHLSGYKTGRDYPSHEQTSKLSVHLHFGEISPAQVWHSVHTLGQLHASEDNLEHFLSEITWREFSAYLMVHFKNLPFENFQTKFNRFPWQYRKNNIHAWKMGQTGYPLVDAGMRELWQTGYMHNRVRMIVASFLVKNLMIHWHVGRDWFWDCLVDADLANNSASWQWVAGCGADAAPYFRIFNPITQGEKFDREGHYTRKFVPELKNLPTQYLFKPWQAPETVLADSGIILGKNYPKPIIDLKSSREQALLAYQSLRNTPKN